MDNNVHILAQFIFYNFQHKSLYSIFCQFWLYCIVVREYDFKFCFYLHKVFLMQTFHESSLNYSQPFLLAEKLQLAK